MRVQRAARRVGWGPPTAGAHLFLKALLTMALSTRRSPTCDGPRKWNISMARSVGWAWHSRLQGASVTPQPWPHAPAAPHILPDPARAEETPKNVTSGFQPSKLAMRRDNKQTVLSVNPSLGSSITMHPWDSLYGIAQG